MNGTTIGSVARVIALTVVVITAAVLGLVLANALQDRGPASAAANVGGNVATTETYPDFGQRQATKAASAAPRSGQRKAAPATADVPAGSLTTPTPR
jgi:hypothetical protein